MAHPELSIKPILHEITILTGRINAAELDESMEYQRLKALRMLQGVVQILEAFCLAPDNTLAFFTHQFGPSGR